jgi:molybdopterin-guanine dinucleotide biosynthesis protein A
MQFSGIVLCGGQSSRMGTSKALLPFGPELMLQRVVRILRQAVEPVVAVAAPGQELPPLPEDVEVVRDRRPGRGPLEGLLAGLSVVSNRADAAYVTGCDVPLLVPALVRRMLDLLGEFDAAVPRIDGFYHPLAAVYRPIVTPHVEALLAEDRLKIATLYDRVPTREVARSELLDVDPDLGSLLNLNRTEDYREALRRAALPVPAAD